MTVVNAPGLNRICETAKQAHTIINIMGSTHHGEICKYRCDLRTLIDAIIILLAHWT